MSTRSMQIKFSDCERAKCRHCGRPSTYNYSSIYCQRHLHSMDTNCIEEWDSKLELVAQEELLDCIIEGNLEDL